MSSKSKARLKARRTRSVLELRPAQVEHEGLHDPGRAHRELLADDAALPHGREVVGRRPVAGAVLGAEVVAVALEGLEQHGRVAVVLVADLVEIVPAAVHRQIAAPIVGHALVDGGAAGVEALQPVGAGAERRLERGLGRVAAASVRGRALPPVLRQHRQLADDLRQLAVAGLREGEGDLALAGLLRLGYVLVVEGVLRAVRLEGLEREDHVRRRDRPAVMPARLLAQPIGDGGMSGGWRTASARRPYSVPTSSCAVFHERVVDERRCRSRARLSRPATKRLKLSKVPCDAEAHEPALRRVRVDVVEMREAGRVFRLAEEREPVPPFRLAGAGGGRGRDGEKRRERGAKKPYQWRLQSPAQQRPCGPRKPVIISAASP